MLPLSKPSRCHRASSSGSPPGPVALREFDLPRVQTVKTVGVKTKIPMHLAYYVRAEEILAFEPLLARFKRGITTVPVSVVDITHRA